MAGVQDAMVLAQQRLARILGNLAELVVGVPDDALDVRDRDDRRLIQRVSQILQLFDVIGASRVSDSRRAERDSINRYADGRAARRPLTLSMLIR